MALRRKHGRSTPRINSRFAWHALRIGRSRIHGTGVFALEDIPPGKRVIEYTGKRLTFSQAAQLDQQESRYLVRLNWRYMLDGRTGGSGAERINHSCNPNLIWKRTKNHIVFYSKRRIQAGEELTFRYAYPVKITKVPCHCGAPNCRRVVRYLLN